MRFRRHPDVVTRPIGDEALLVPIRESISDLEWVFSLNDVAAAVWNALEQPHTLDEMVAEICSTFEVDPAEARADLETLLEDLHEVRLVMKE